MKIILRDGLPYLHISWYVQHLYPLSCYIFFCRLIMYVYTFCYSITSDGNYSILKVQHYSAIHKEIYEAVGLSEMYASLWGK